MNESLTTLNTVFAFGPLFAFGFAQAALLGWLGAASIPIVLHLWNRHRRKDVDWAAMRFLLAAMQRRSRLRRIEHWLLLALRTLLICAVVFAAARPYAESRQPLGAAGQPVHRIVVIDGSMSMARTNDDRTVFSRAQQTAVELVAQFGGDDGVSLLLMADPPQVFFAQPSFDSNLVVDEIGRLAVTHRQANLGDTVAQCEAIATRTRDTHPQLDGTDVYFITDLVENDWGPHRRDTSLVDRWQRLRELAAVHIVDVGASSGGNSGDAANVAVTQLRAVDPFVLVGQPSNYEVELTSFAEAARDVDVELLVEGRTVARQHVTMPAGQSQTIQLSGVINDAGLRVVEARISDDQLGPDNSGWLVVTAEDAVNVLCVDGNPAGSPLAGSCGYLAVALAPQTAADLGATGASSVVRPKIVGEGSWLDEDLSRYAVVALCNVGQFTAAEAAALEAYLRRGGAVWCFLGDRAQLDNYNRLLSGATATVNAADGNSADEKGASEKSAPTSILPARLLEVAPAGAYTLDPLDYAHPIIAPFRDHQRAGLLTTPVERYVRLAPHDGARTVLATDNGDPLIVEANAFAGKSILIATSADDSWTAMPMLPSYVPLVQEMLRYAVERRTALHNLHVGQPIDLVTTNPNLPVTIRTPAGRDVSLDNTDNTSTPDNDTDANLGAPAGFDDTMHGGVYRVQSGDDESPYAVNVDTRESDLRKTSIDALTEALDNAGGFDYVAAGARIATTDALPGRNAGWQRMLLFGALGLILMESFTAWHLGRQGGGR